MDEISIEKILKYNIYFKGKELYIGDYELKNAQVLMNSFNNNEKVNLFMNPQSLEVKLLSLIILSTKVYIGNLENIQTDILDYLKPGYTVNYDGQKVEYCGIDDIFGEEKIKLRYKKNDITWIRLSDAYKLSLNKGMSTNLNVMGSGNKFNKKSGLYILADMLHLKSENLNKVINNKMLVVYQPGNELKTLLDDIKIKVKNKKYGFTEIFPSKYNYDDLKGNKLKLDEILIFTSRLDNAMEIIREDKKIDKILLVGENTYISEIGGALDILLNRSRIKKIFILNNFNKSSKISEILDENYDINLYAWTKNALLNNFKSSLNNITLLHQEIDVLKNREVSHIVLKEQAEICGYIFDLKRSLYNISSDDVSYENTNNFLMASYGLLKIFEKLTVPICEYDRYIEENSLKRYTIEKILESLYVAPEKYCQYKSYSEDLKKVVELSEKLKDILYNKNPKLEYIRNMDLQKMDLIICSNPIEKSVLKKYGSFNVLCIKDFKLDFKPKKIYRNVVFTGIYDSNKIDQLSSYIGYSVLNLLYPTEVFKYNSKIDKYNRKVKQVEESNKLSTDKTVDLMDKAKIDFTKFKEVKKENREEIVVQELDEKIEKNVYRSYARDNYLDEINLDCNIDDLLNISEHDGQIIGGNNYNNNSNSSIDMCLEFEKHKIALLTRFYKVKCVENSTGKVLNKDIQSLKVGDNILFINYKNESDLGNLFRKIIYSDKFKLKYRKHYNNMRYWKESLKCYMYNNQLAPSNITTELLIQGVSRGDMAIKNWISGNEIVGPREKETYGALAKITGDPYFLNNWEDIYNSCNLMRKFRMNFKKNDFNTMVIRSVMKKLDIKDELGQLINEFIDDIEEYGQIVTIKKILNVSLNVPANRTNCIIDKSAVDDFFY
ncbi:DrmE family protein [Clostridium tyrobutyricum]|uniref:DrmE family protein n=1 Tax=Clostridium tyrobutyricum TaxID=1519 RepID=UPI0011C95510|nr:DrmE family protein [Clostridium tyrobutyricum]